VTLDITPKKEQKEGKILLIQRKPACDEKKKQKVVIRTVSSLLVLVLIQDLTLRQTELRRREGKTLF